jgi:rRNA-processing arch domain
LRRWQQRAGASRDACDEYVALRDERGALQAAVQAAWCQPRVCLGFLTAGRLVHVQAGGTAWGWGVVLTHSFKPPQVAEVRGNALMQQQGS